MITLRQIHPKISYITAMTTMNAMIGHLPTYGLIWVMLVGVLGALTLWLLWQYRRRRALNEEIELASGLCTNSIEHEMVLRAMRLSTWRIDADTRKVIYGPDYRDRTVHHEGEILDDYHDIISFIVPEDADRVIRDLDALCQGKIDDSHQAYRIKIPNDRGYSWNSSMAIVAERHTDGTPSVIVGTSQCIDQQKSMEAELVNARNSALENDRLKSAFLASISHEVRTPLNAIVGFSEVLIQVDDPTERQNYMEIIRNNNHQLLSLFDEMVSMSKAEATGDSRKADKKPFALVDLIRSLAADSRSSNTNEKIEVKCRCDNDGLELVNDKLMLAEVLRQFLSNALKFTREGEVVIGYRILDDGNVRIFVSDTGIGISEEEQKHIFDRFYKIDTFVPGMGLGLAICRTNAFLMGGNVGVNSTLGAGSTFWIDMPK